MSLTQAQFETALADELAISKGEAVKILDAVTELTYRELKKGAGESVTIRGIGKISLKETPAKPARMGRNPATGEQMKFKAKPKGRKLKVLFNKALKERLKSK